ncbi:MAG: hypothetical protein ACREVK_07655 [Gammaproteobacteria bacterium]
MLNVVEVLRGRGLDDKEHAQWGLDMLHRQVRHLTRLVDDLLDVARISRVPWRVSRSRPCILDSGHSRPE